MFDQKQLFVAALGLQNPWILEDVSFNPLKGRLDIYIKKSKVKK